MHDPEDYRDTLPPSCDEFELEKGQSNLSGITKSTTRQLIADIACGVEVLKRGQQEQCDLLMKDHEELRRLVGRVSALERDNQFGSRLPMMVAGVALITSLASMTVSAIQGWTMVATAHAAEVTR